MFLLSFSSSPDGGAFVDHTRGLHWIDTNSVPPKQDGGKDVNHLLCVYRQCRERNSFDTELISL